MAKRSTNKLLNDGLDWDKNHVYSTDEDRYVLGETIKEV